MVRPGARAAAPWSISAAIHMLLLFLLVRIVWNQDRRPDAPFIVTLRPTEPARIAPALPTPAPAAFDTGSLPPTTSMIEPDEPPPSGPELLTGDPLPHVAVPPAPAPVMVAVTGAGGSPTTSRAALSARQILSGRGAGARGGQLQKFGGTPASEQAVLDGLRWLASHQEPTGEWLSGDLMLKRCPAKDRCKGTTAPGFTGGVTGLALLCFLSAGHDGADGEFADVVTRGLAKLVSDQRPDGTAGGGGGNLYNHAIVTLTLCEAAAMTRRRDLRSAARAAVRALEAARGWNTGWDYEAGGTRNDWSIGGWVVMALKSAEMAGLDVADATWNAVADALAEATSPNGRVRYARRDWTSSRRGDALTAVGILTRYYLGDADPGLQSRAAEFLRSHPPNWPEMKNGSADHCYYGWYYSTLAMFQRGGAEWDAWNKVMRDLLVARQSKQGHAAGSWDPVDIWGKNYGGRLYSTTLAILTLEVYYRYLPLYAARGEDAPANLATAAARSRSAAAARRDAEKSPEAYLADLVDRDEFARWRAARALADRKDARALPILRDWLPGMPTDLQPMILEALGRFEDPGQVDFLLAFLRHRDARVRTAALHALHRSTNTDTLDELNRYLANRR